MSSPTVPCSLFESATSAPHRAKILGKATGREVQVLTQCSSTRLSEALPAPCLEGFLTRHHELRDMDGVILLRMGENVDPSLLQPLVILRQLLTGPSLQGSETRPKVRLGGGRVAAAPGSQSPIRDAMQRQETFVWWKPPPEP